MGKSSGRTGGSAKHRKRCPPAPARRGMQIKTPRRYHDAPVRVIEVKNSDNTKHRQSCGEIGSLYIAEEGETMGQQLHSGDLSQRSENVCPHENLYRNVCRNFMYNSPQLEKSSCPSPGEWLNKRWHIPAWHTAQPGKGMRSRCLHNQGESTGTCAPCWVTSIRSHVL